MTATATPCAALAMYDWPEVNAVTDQLWQHLRTALENAGVTTPDTLDRDTELKSVWLNPGLVLAQTCGFPYLNWLTQHTTLLGTPVYDVDDIDGCEPGYYRSLLLANRADSRSTLDAFAGTTLAVNGVESQSGYNALRLQLATQRSPCDTPFFETLQITGSHRASIHSVASGRADLCAVDPVSWILARDHDAAVISQLHIVGRTPPTPALPLICSNRVAAQLNLNDLTSALKIAIEKLPANISNPLHLRGLVYLEHDVYQQLAAATDYAIECGFGVLADEHIHQIE